MCGRYTLTHPAAELARVFGFLERPNLPPRYNAAPTQELPVVRRRADADGCKLVSMRWGLVPFWADDPSIGSRMINARSETALEKASFRNAMRERRCLVPADGFYEWKAAPGGTRQPFRIVARDRGPFAFAGLWEVWKGPKGAPLDRPLQSFTILTTTANRVLRPLHERMPVILDPAAFDAWLDPDIPVAEAASLLRPCPDDRLEVYPVSTRVNAVRNDDEACIAPLAEEPPRLL
jgi:putative SOS response-associated peptidase YedK